MLNREWGHKNPTYHPINQRWCSGVNYYTGIIMSAMASQITRLTIVYSTVYPGSDQRKHQSSASLAFVWRIHRLPVNSPHKGPVTQKMFLFDDVIMHHGNSLCIHFVDISQYNQRMEARLIYLKNIHIYLRFTCSNQLYTQLATGAEYLSLEYEFATFTELTFFSSFKYW